MHWILFEQYPLVLKKTSFCIGFGFKTSRDSLLLAFLKQEQSLKHLRINLGKADELGSRGHSQAARVVLTQLELAQDCSSSP